MMNKAQVEKLHPLEIKTLRAFKGSSALGTKQIESATGLEPGQVRRAVEWLLTRNSIELVDETIKRYVKLTETGEEYAEKGIPELRILAEANEGITMKELQSKDDLDPEEIGPSIGALKKFKLLQFGKGGRLIVSEGGNTEVLQKIQSIIESYQDKGEIEFSTISESDRKEIENLSRKRGKAKGVFRIDDRKFRTYRITKLGGELLENILSIGATGEEISTLEPKHLKDGKWRELNFRRYSLDLKPPRMVAGKRHPYREFLDFVKTKLLSMGFQEMRGDHIEPEFWNMDALFMPQFHSARDIHDVYYSKVPSKIKEIEEPFFTNVANAHSNGGNTGSKGWGYTFDKERSRKLVLRSQGTALSAQWLHQAEVPGKYFAMARCFRYDSVDATHAADFFQIEGIVLAEDITFRTLLGLLKMFAVEVAQAEEIKFLPGYFPFTEPSVEAHIKHPTIGWMEMGGAGIFRPEVTTPQGVKVPVIAWGLGLDRMAMVAMGIDDIRDLFTTDLNKIRSTRVRFNL